MIQAIETKYNGYRFRSRLEARWAVFFDAAGVKWEYEKEGFDLTSIVQSRDRFKDVLKPDECWYLPDFYLPDHDAFVEIKPTLSEYLGMDPDAKGYRKAVFLSFEKRGICIFGTPGDDSYIVKHLTREHINNQYVLAQGRKCERLWLVNTDPETFEQHALNCSNCPESKCGDKETGAHLGLLRAYAEARSYRF